MEKIDKLKQLMKLLQNDTITPQEVEKFLSMVVESVKKAKDNFEQISKENIEQISEFLDYMKAEHENVLSRTQSAVEMTENTISEFDSKLAEAKALVENLRLIEPKHGIDGKDADEEYIISEVLNRIELPEPKEVELDTGEDIIEKINMLPIDNEAFQIDASHIKNLPALGRNVGSQARNLWQLQDVTITDPTNNEVIKYNSTTGQWENGTGGGSASPLTTKGDLYTYSTENTRLPVGANGKFLKADSTQPTGLIWADGDGIGTVTDFVFTDGNGFNGTVTSSTSTPTLSLTTTVTDTQLMYSNAGAIAGISGATTNGTAVTYTTGNLIAHDVKASQSAGIDILSNAGTVTALFGAGGGANSTFYGGSKFDYATATTIPYFDASKNLISSAVTPTELGYLSGVTSAIQTQLSGKWSLTGNAGTTAGTNFLGTTDDIDVVFKRNSIEVIRLPTGSTSSDTYTQFNGSNSANFLDSTGNTFIQRIISGDINIVNGGGASQLTVGTASIQLSPDTYAELTSAKPFRYSTSGGYVALKAPASVAASFTLTLPNTDSTGTQALVSDGAGTLSWSSIGGGTPGGSNTQVQYNNAGSFAGISGATTNGTVMTLTSPIVATSQTNSYATASTIGIFDGSKNLISADTATYPSLTELSYVKGATSSIQTQLGTKQTTGTDITLEENTSIILDPALSADGKYTGITRTGTAGTTLAFGDLCYLDPTDSRWELVDANSAQGADGDARGVVGMCVLAAAGDGSATNILLYGTIRADTAFPAMTVNNQMYVSETAGDITGTQPSTSGVVIRVVGVALTADELLFNPSPDYITHA